MENTEKQVRDGASWAANKGSDYVKEFGEKAQGKATEFGEKLKQAGEKIASTSIPDMEEARRLYQEGKSQAYGMANSFGKNLSARVRENPILTSVTCVAVGFGIASWLLNRSARD